MHCPSCGQPLPEPLPETRPFCSERCRWLDLWHWLEEEQRIPLENPTSD